MNNKQIKLRSLLLLSILVTTFIAFSVAIGIVSYKARNLALRNAGEIAEEMGSHYALQAKSFLDNALGKAGELGLILESMVETGITDRDSVILMLHKTLKMNPSFFGVWTCWEPGAFDGSDEKFVDSPLHDQTGRFIPYVYSSGDQIDMTALEAYDQEGKGDYYLLAKRSGSEVVMDPFNYEVGGKEVLMTTVTVPVKRNGKVLGAVGIDISLDALSSMISGIRPFDVGYATLISNKGTLVGDGLDPAMGENRVGKGLDLFRNKDDLEAVKNGEFISKKSFSSNFDDNMLRLYLPVQLGETDRPWSLNINIPEEKINEEAQAIAISGIITGIISLLIISAVLLLLAARVSRPISLAVEKMKNVANGDLTEKIVENFKIREITELKEAINTMIEDVSGSVMEIRQVSDEVSIKAEELSAASEESTAAIEEVAALTNKTAATTQEAASSVEETNASAEEVSNGAQSAAQAASEAGEHASQISSAADEGGRELEEMMALIREVENAASSVGSAINDLAGSVSDISSFVEIITQIADQTNLLALNAAIEAARAGEAGQGFAVVAEEVRKLAEQSNGAAAKVGKVIGEISQKTDNAMKDQNKTGVHVQQLVQKAEITHQSVQDVVVKVGTISDSIQTIAATMEEQSASTQEMTAAMENIASSAQEGAKNVENINASMEEQGKVAETIAHDSEVLVDLSKRMQEAVVRFRVAYEKNS